MTAQVINLFEPCYICGKPPVDGERCADCLAYRSVLKSIARNIRHHLKICKNKERCLLCNSYGCGYDDAIDKVAGGY